MSTRYAVAVLRVKDAERSQDPSEQLSWAGNEMASILREGDSVPIESPIAWAGLAMVHKAQHEIASAFETEQNELMEVEEHALYSLKQVPQFSILLFHKVFSHFLLNKISSSGYIIQESHGVSSSLPSLTIKNFHHFVYGMLNYAYFHLA